MFPHEYRRALGEQYLAQVKADEAVAEQAKRDRVMGKITGFMELERVQEVALPVGERLRHYREFILDAQG